MLNCVPFVLNSLNTGASIGLPLMLGIDNWRSSCTWEPGDWAAKESGGCCQFELGVCECLIGGLIGGLIGLMRDGGGCCQFESQTGADEADRHAPHHLALPEQSASVGADNPFHAAVRGSRRWLWSLLSRSAGKPDSSLSGAGGCDSLVTRPSAADAQLQRQTWMPQE